MPEGHSWLSVLLDRSGHLHEKLLHFVESFGGGWFFGSHVMVQHVLSMLLVTLLMLVLGLRARSQLDSAKGDVLPEERLTARTLVELIMEGLLTVMQFAMPREAALRHFWLIGTLGFFILFSNLLGLIPGFVPPTESFNTTLACGTFVFLYYNAYAMYRLGMSHLTHLANPVGETWGWFLSPLFIIVEPISHMVRPCSLGIRLMCNIAGDHLVLSIFVGIFPFLLPMPFLGLGLFVALIQTFIFVLLASVYVGEVEDNIAHHAHHAAHEHAHQAHAEHAVAQPTGA